MRIVDSLALANRCSIGARIKIVWRSYCQKRSKLEGGGRGCRGKTQKNILHQKKDRFYLKKMFIYKRFFTVFHRFRPPDKKKMWYAFVLGPYKDNGWFMLFRLFVYIEIIRFMGDSFTVNLASVTICSPFYNTPFSPDFSVLLPFFFKLGLSCWLSDRMCLIMGGET